MIKQIKVDEVNKLLNDLSSLGKSKIPLDKKGNIDLKLFDKIPEVKLIINRLKKFKITSDWLFDNGFVPAGILLGRYL